MGGPGPFGAGYGHPFASEPSGSGGGGGGTDGFLIVADIAALQAIVDADLSPNESHLVWVTSVGDYWRLQTGTTITTDGITVVNAQSGAAQWTREMVPNAFWQSKQNYWAISPATGDDENAGWGATKVAAEAHPLATLAEFVRRLKGAKIIDILVVSIMDDVDENIIITGFTTKSTVAVDTGQEGTLLFLGTPTVIHSGTLTAVTNQSGNTRGTVTDSALPVSWTASGCIGTLEQNTCIRTTNLLKHAWIYADQGSKTVQIATPTDTTFEVVDQQTSCVRSNFVNGDSYQVVTYSKLSTVRVTPEIYVRLQGLTVGGDAVNGSTPVHPSAPSAILATGVWFGYAAILGFGPLGALNCGFANSGFTNVNGAFQSCMWLNNRTGGTVFNDSFMNFEGVQTIAKMAYMWFKGRKSGCSYLETGDNVHFAVWDCSDEVIYLDGFAALRIDKLEGAGNLGSIVSLASENTSVFAGSSHFTDWIAAGSGLPIKFSNTDTFAYATLPVRDDQLNKQISGLA